MNKRPVCITLEPLTPDPEVRLLQANLYNGTGLVLTFSLTEYIKSLVNQVEWACLMSMKSLFTYNINVSVYNTVRMIVDPIIPKRQDQC